MTDTGSWLALHLKLSTKPYTGYKQVIVLAQIPGLVPETSALHGKNLIIYFKAGTVSS